ncbi:MAG: hypothetical protein HQ541_02035 [Mariniphaga sp.]|nr:hypothetical protein [Mariniphaga sp.]
MQLDEGLIKELEKSIIDYSDEEVMEILKKRKHYNPIVVKMTIEEAVKRGIINSESDLVAEDYRVEPFRFHIFPSIEKHEIRIRVIKSLSRGILLAGIIPTIFGFLRIAENKMIEAFILLCLGGIWIASAALLMRSFHQRFIYLILSMGGLSVIYVAKVLLGLKPFRFMDMFVALIIYGVIFYSLLYIKSLIKINSKD